MAEKSEVQCPACTQRYRVEPSRLGATTRCKKCGEQFVLEVMKTLTVVPPPALPAKQQPAKQPISAKPKGFFARMNDAVEDARRKAALSFTAKYQSGILNWPQGTRFEATVNGESISFTPTVPTHAVSVTRIALGSISAVRAYREHEISLHAGENLVHVITSTTFGSIQEVAEKILRWQQHSGLLSDGQVKEQIDSVKAGLAGFQEQARIKRENKVLVKYLHGPFRQRPDSLLNVRVEDGDMIAEEEGFFSSQEVFRIPLTAIKGTELETSEKMTLGRTGAGYLLGGPVGALIAGFGFKKQEKLLRVDFDDQGLDSSILFGPSIGSVEQLDGIIHTAFREARIQRDRLPAPQTVPKQTPAGPSGLAEITAAIEKLAALREQGILTEDEFAKKKAELLSRL